MEKGACKKVLRNEESPIQCTTHQKVSERLFCPFMKIDHGEIKWNDASLKRRNEGRKWMALKASKEWDGFEGSNYLIKCGPKTQNPSKSSQETTIAHV